MEIRIGGRKEGKDKLEERKKERKDGLEDGRKERQIRGRKRGKVK